MKYLLFALVATFASPAVSQPISDADVQQISKCWAVGSLSGDTLRSSITITATIDASGKMAAAEIVSQRTPSDIASAAAFSAAEKAISRCARNSTWRNQIVTLEFDYSLMRIDLRATKNSKSTN